MTTSLLESERVDSHSGGDVNEFMASGSIGDWGSVNARRDASLPQKLAATRVQCVEISACISDGGPRRGVIAPILSITGPI